MNYTLYMKLQTENLGHMLKKYEIYAQKIKDLCNVMVLSMFTIGHSIYPHAVIASDWLHGGICGHLVMLIDSRYMA